ncbi:MAG: metal ABC transporter permease, partial [Acidimicrobiia bacterium]|nr:metal ABC transporter permease [Acidimicrobiia bacterium]
GTLLVFGLLVAPPATATLLARRLPMIMATSVVIGWAAVVVGLTVSYHADTAASASVAGAAVVQFFVVLAVSELVRAMRSQRTRRRPGPAGQLQAEQVPTTSNR